MIEKPFILAGKKLSTRLVFPPLATESSDGGKPNEKITQHYCAIAANPNVGMIITEHSYVDPQGKADPHQISFADDSVFDAQKAMVKSIRNVRPDICLLAQINHAGANTRKLYTGMDLVSASDIKWTRDQARALTVDEIHDLEQKYIAAALRVQEAGYDGVEIHCAHAYLLNQFYSPITNHRDDEYGPQTITNRLRFTLEIIRGIKAKANKNFIVSVRLGGCDYKEGGSTIEDACAAAKLLEREHIDLLNLSGGTCQIFRPGHAEPGFFTDMSEAVKKCVFTPILVAGGITTKKEADLFLREGKADLIGVARALNADPKWEM